MRMDNIRVYLEYFALLRRRHLAFFFSEMPQVSKYQWLEAQVVLSSLEWTPPNRLGCNFEPYLVVWSPSCKLTVTVNPNSLKSIRVREKLVGF
jgi:hypothetical protein